MTKEFYDGLPRPSMYGNWTDEELDRICFNCGKRFGRHLGYTCPESE